MTNSGAILFWLFITIILVLTSLGRVIYAFLNGEYFRRDSLQRLLLILRNTLSPRINNRLASDILSSYLRDSKIPLIFSTYALLGDQDYVFIQASETGRITDINLCKLEKFAQFLDREAQKNNYSFTDNPPSGAEESKHTGFFKHCLSKLCTSLWAKISRNPAQKTSSQTLRPTKNRHRYLLKQYGDIISYDNGTSVLCYDRQLITNNPQAQRNLEKIAEKIFTIKPVKRGAE